jgi:hypothetical protein
LRSYNKKVKGEEERNVKEIEDNQKKEENEK